MKIIKIFNIFILTLAFKYLSFLPEEVALFPPRPGLPVKPEVDSGTNRLARVTKDECGSFGGRTNPGGG